MSDSAVVDPPQQSAPCKLAEDPTLKPSATPLRARTTDEPQEHKNTPLNATESSTQTWGIDAMDAKIRYARYAEEAQRFTLGPIPPQDFLDRYMEQTAEQKSSEARKNMLPSKGAFNAVPARAVTDEKLIYAPLVSHNKCIFCGRDKRIDIGRLLR